MEGIDYRLAREDMDKIVILGSAGQAKVVIEIVLHEGKHEILGLLERGRARAVRFPAMALSGRLRTCRRWQPVSSATP